MQSNRPVQLSLRELVERADRYGITIEEVAQAHHDGISLETPADRPENALDRWIRTPLKPREDRSETQQDKPETQEDKPETPADRPENALDRWIRTPLKPREDRSETQQDKPETQEDKPETQADGSESALDRWIRTSFFHQFHEPREDIPETQEVGSMTAQDKWIQKSIEPKMPDLSGGVVTIYISMHGADTDEKIPTYPTNTSVTGSVGLLVTASFNLMYTISRLRELYKSTPMSVANETVWGSPMFRYIDSPFSNFDYLRVADKLKEPEGPTNYWRTYKPTGIEDDEVVDLYKSQCEKTNLRVLYKNRRYSTEDDTHAFHDGIFIISSLRAPSCEPYSVPVKDLPQSSVVYDQVESPEMTELLNQKFSHFSPSDKTLKRKSIYDSQIQNLLNPEIARAIGGRGLCDLSGNELPTSRDYSGVEHYVGVHLSHLLYFFERIGVTHVNIIENSCRVLAYPSPAALSRQQSKKETDLGELAIQELKKNGMGGTLKRRRHRLKRTVNKRRRPPHKVSTKKRYGGQPLKMA